MKRTQDLLFAGKGAAFTEYQAAFRGKLQLVKEQSSPDKTKNMVIRGDNIDALKILKRDYAGKIKMIYIDPPYNTKSSVLTYQNNYKSWLAFMYARLLLARDLMSEDGFIALAIDHYELGNLLVLCDEIFGLDNRLGIVTVLHNPRGRQFTQYFSHDTEFMLVYCKKKSKAKFRKVALTERVRRTFNLTDDNGNYREEEYMLRRMYDTRRSQKPKYYYPIYVSPDLQKIGLTEHKGWHKVVPHKNGIDWTWKNIPDSFERKNAVEGYFSAKTNDKGEVVVYHKYYEQELFTNLWQGNRHHSRASGTNIVKGYFGTNVFTCPKSVFTVMDALKLMTEKDDIVLDFFGGSGTTADAVMRLNHEDGGNRSFILVQIDEPITAKDNHGYAFCVNNNLEPIISSLTIERIARCVQGKAGFKVYRITE